MKRDEGYIKENSQRDSFVFRQSQDERELGSQALRLPLRSGGKSFVALPVCIFYFLPPVAFNYPPIVRAS